MIRRAGSSTEINNEISKYYQSDPKSHGRECPNPDLKILETSGKLKAAKEAQTWVRLTPPSH